MPIQTAVLISVAYGALVAALSLVAQVVALGITDVATLRVVTPVCGIAGVLVAGVLAIGR